MSEWKKVKIGEFLMEREGRFKPDDKRISKYQRLDKIDFSGNIHLSNKPTKTDMILVQPGDLVISGINVAKGAITVYQGEEPVCATIHYSSYTFDSSKVDLDYFKFFVKSAAFIAAMQKQVKGGIKTEIKPKHLLALEISIPDLGTQKKIVKEISSQLEKTEQLSSEIEKQKSYAKQLCQNILQEAIEGKLTADWRKQHPVQKGNSDYDAQALFARIQSEKSENKTNKKPLAPITKDEIPFEIPTNWKWVRLGEISESCLGKMLDGIKNQGVNRKYLRNLNVRWFSFDLSDLLEMRIKDDEFERCSAHRGDLLICEGGYPGRSAIWNEDYDMCFQKAIHRVRFYGLSDMPRLFNLFLFWLSESRKIEKYLTGEGIKHLTGVKLKQMILPLPPLAEQKEIVARIEQHLQTITQLETQIASREATTKQLMQSILKNAFEEKHE